MELRHLRIAAGTLDLPHTLGFELPWPAQTPSPVLAEEIRIAAKRATPTTSIAVPALSSVA